MSKRRKSSAASFGGSQFGVQTSHLDAAATNAAIEGMNLLKRAAEGLGLRRTIHPESAQGNLFEFIEAAKFNTNAARQGASVRAHVTAAEGQPTAPADIIIRDEGRHLLDVQAKSMNSPARGAFQLSDPKYRGMQKLVPKEQVDRVQELSSKRASTGTLKAEDYQDTANHVTGELRAQGVRSEGTTRQEALDATHNPNSYALRMELKQVAREAGSASIQAAKAGAVMGGAIAGLQNGLSVWSGELTVSEALEQTAKDSIKAGVRSGATAAVGTIVRYGASKAGLQTFAKSNIATSVAAGFIEVGVTVYDFARGEITPEMAMERIGQTGFSTMSGFYTGMAAGAFFGPVGAAIGATAGYLLSSQVYQSCIEIFRRGRLAEEEAIRVAALCEVAYRRMEEQRQAFEMRVEAALEIRAQTFQSCFAAINEGLDSGRPQLTISALADFSALLGKCLRLESFEEFDDFMMHSNKPLVL